MNLRIQIENHKFSAMLHRNRAPKTCNAILKVLPIEGKVIHARWSGEAMWLQMHEIPIDIGFENNTSHPSKGELLFYPGFISEKEILIPYGSCSFASKAGPLSGNHFGTITENLDGLAKVGENVFWKGAEKIIISEGMKR